MKEVLGDFTKGRAADCEERRQQRWHWIQPEPRNDVHQHREDGEREKMVNVKFARVLTQQALIRFQRQKKHRREYLVRKVLPETSISENRCCAEFAGEV